MIARKDTRHRKKRKPLTEAELAASYLETLLRMGRDTAEIDCEAWAAMLRRAAQPAAIAA